MPNVLFSGVWWTLQNEAPNHGLQHQILRHKWGRHERRHTHPRRCAEWTYEVRLCILCRSCCDLFVAGCLLRLIASEDILVGHSLENDLKALNMHHSRIIDTALIYPHPRGPPLKSALRCSQPSAAYLYFSSACSCFLDTSVGNTWNVLYNPTIPTDKVQLFFNS